MLSRSHFALPLSIVRLASHLGINTGLAVLISYTIPEHFACSQRYGSPRAAHTRLQILLFHNELVTLYPSP